MTESNSNFGKIGLVSIVAVVGIVGLITLLQQNGGAAVPASTTGSAPASQEEAAPASERPTQQLPEDISEQCEGDRECIMEELNSREENTVGNAQGELCTRYSDPYSGCVVVNCLGGRDFILC